MFKHNMIFFIMMGNVFQLDGIREKRSTVCVKSIKNAKSLTVIIQQDNVAGLQQYIDKGISPDYKLYNEVPLFNFASNKKSIKIMKFLVSQGANVNAKSEWGLTTLHSFLSWDPLYHYKTYDQYISMLKMLLDFGVDPNIPDDDGNMPLAYIEKEHGIESIKLLLSYGANPNIIRYNHTFLNSCIIRKMDISIIAELVECSVDINGKDPDEYGYGPLHWSVLYENLEISKYLLNKGANINLVTNQNITPLQIAIAKENKDLIELLSQF